ncbi:MAG: beta-lactamase family protein [Planctomycetes bacterium]|nr:beta-lactamase family protein [Planctomycetota bacterium]
MPIASPTPTSSRRRKVLALVPTLVALVTGAAPATAQEALALVDRLDGIAGAEVRAGRSVGIVANVTKANESLLLRAYGKTDVETDEAISVDTVVSVGSVTKQFTAAAILRLRDREKLTLDDEVTEWLPDFRTHGNKVTLRHLLGHTSGVADFTAMPELRRLRMLRNPDLTRDAIYEVVNTQPFQFPTGTRQAYSNTGYWLLGRIVEKASGTGYEDFVERELLAPLGMTRTRFGSDAEELPRCAAGHGVRGGTPRRAPRIVHTGTFAAGALYSTGEDMVVWLRALHRGKVLSAKSYVDMIAPSCLADGTPTRYGMGMVLGLDRHGRSFLGHDGGGFGFSAVTRWYPDAELAVVVLTNSEPDAITAVADELVAAVLPQPPEAKAFQGDSSVFVGKYGGPGRTAGTNLLVEVTKTATGLALSVEGGAAEPLLWTTEWAFRSGDSMVVFFGGGEGGAATKLRFDTGGDHVVLTRQ